MKKIWELIFIRGSLYGLNLLSVPLLVALRGQEYANTIISEVSIAMIIALVARLGADQKVAFLHTDRQEIHRNTILKYVTIASIITSIPVFMGLLKNEIAYLAFTHSLTNVIGFSLIGLGRANVGTMLTMLPAIIFNYLHAVGKEALLIQSFAGTILIASIIALVLKSGPETQRESSKNADLTPRESDSVYGTISFTRVLAREIPVVLMGLNGFNLLWIYVAVAKITNLISALQSILNNANIRKISNTKQILIYNIKKIPAIMFYVIGLFIVLGMILASNGADNKNLLFALIVVVYFTLAFSIALANLKYGSIGLYLLSIAKGHVYAKYQLAGLLFCALGVYAITKFCSMPLIALFIGLMPLAVQYVISRKFANETK